MNSVAPIRPNPAPISDPLPVSLELPAMTLELSTIVDDVLNARTPRSCPAVLRGEAMALIPAYEAACQPVSHTSVAAWLRFVNFASSNPISTNEMTQRIAVIGEALASLPTGVFTRETRNAAARTMKFFPGAAEIHEFLSKKTATLQFTLRGLRRIADLSESEKPAPVLSQAERDSILAKFRCNLAAVNVAGQ
jgi:hypothetical protein